MTKLLWDQTGDRQFELGCDHGVLYPMDVTGTYPLGVPWNGLISVTESPSGAEPTPMYADNMKYVELMSLEEFACSIEAYTYPDEFAECDGSAEPKVGVSIGQQNRKAFGLAYRTKIGNDVAGQDLGYKIHVVWGAKAAPSEKAYSTINDSPEASTFSWEITTTPVAVTGYKPTASMVFDSTKISAPNMALIEGELFGDDTTGVANLPTPDALLALLTV